MDRISIGSISKDRISRNSIGIRRMDGFGISRDNIEIGRMDGFGISRGSIGYFGSTMVGDRVCI